jgi:hypothetical protein
MSKVFTDSVNVGTNVAESSIQARDNPRKGARLLQAKLSTTDAKTGEVFSEGEVVAIQSKEHLNPATSLSLQRPPLKTGKLSSKIMDCGNGTAVEANHEPGLAGPGALRTCAQVIVVGKCTTRSLIGVE